MLLAFKLSDIVTVPFGWLLSVLYQLTTNYGVALILFAVLVKLILLPMTAKGKKSTMKLSRLTPRLQAIQKKYANDQQKQGEAMRELYRSEGVSMGGGCLWSFIPILILIPLYTVVRQPIIYMLSETAEVAGQLVNTIKDAAPALFDKNEFYHQMVAAAQIPNFVPQIQAAGIEVGEATLKGINFSFFGIDLAANPQFNIFSSAWQWTWANIGAFLVPVLSAGSQILSMFISNRMNNSLVTNEKGLEDKEAAKNSQQAKQGKMMMWMMPIMSLWIGFSFPVAMSLYWLAQGLISIVIDTYLTNKYRKIYDAEDAIRLQKALEEEALEEEKERQRAERRAANPDGITANTSKKKLQQNKQREQEAAKATAAQEYAAKKGETVAKDTSVLSGIPERPYAKGRAYDPSRYSRQSTEEE